MWSQIVVVGRTRAQNHHALVSDDRNPTYIRHYHPPVSLDTMCIAENSADPSSLPSLLQGRPGTQEGSLRELADCSGCRIGMDEVGAARAPLAR